MENILTTCKIDDLKTWSTYTVDIVINNKTYRKQRIFILNNKSCIGAFWYMAPRSKRKYICLDWDNYVHNPVFVCKGFIPIY